MLHRTLRLLTALLALPAALPAAEIPVTGRVLGPGGEARPGAEVMLEAIPPTYERARLRLLDQPGPDPVDRTRTGADGTFELAAPEAGMWKVVVASPGFLTMEYRLVPLLDAALLEPVELAPAADLEVRMVDAEGKPCPGRLGAFSLGIRGDGWRPRLRLARSGEDGVARLPLGRDEKIQLELLADGHPLQVYSVSEESSVRIELPAGVSAAVRIVDSRKRPLPEAVALLGSGVLPLGLADEEGRLSVVLASGEPPTLRVATADLRNGSFDLDLAAAGQVQDLELHLPKRLHGRVLDLSNRDPVAGALVWAVRGQMAVTDERGGYELPVGIYGAPRVRAHKAGYLEGLSLMRDASEEVPAIALTPAAVLAGRVIDGDGEPLEDVSVNLKASLTAGELPRVARRRLHEGWNGRTTSRGAFRMAELPSGVRYRLTFQAAGYAPLVLDVDPLEPFESRSGIEVVLQAGRRAVGLVVDEDEVGVPGAEVRLMDPPPTGDLTTTVYWSAGEEASESVYLTDAEGRFEIADLAVGRYDLEVHATGYAPVKVPGVRVDEADGRTDFGTVVLVPGVSIEGRVVDGAGVPVAGAEVTAATERRGFRARGRVPDREGQIRTDPEGRFAVVDLAPDQPVTLSVSKEGYGSEDVSGLRPPTEEPVVVVLRPAGRLRGRVVDSQGDPIQDAVVAAHPDPRAMTSMNGMRGSRPMWTQTDDDGRFLIEGVEPGVLQVSADAEAYQEQVRTGIEVAAGQDLEFNFELRTGAVVEGTVTTSDGEPVAGALLNIRRQVEGEAYLSGGASGQSDVEGRYRIDGVPTGPASISVFHASRERLKKSVEVRPGTTVVDLVLERGFEVSGQVVDAYGKPVGGAAMSIQALRPEGLRVSSGPVQMSRADGTFTLTGVEAGELAVTAEREGYAPARSEAFEVAGDVTGLLLELRRGATLKGRIVGLELDELGSLEIMAFNPQGGMRQGRVDFAAEYAFEGLGPGRWFLRAQVTSSGRTTALQVEVPEGVTEVGRDIEFGVGFTLSGVVLDAGRPLPGAHVIAGNSMESMGQVETGTDGRFHIEGLKAGSYQVMVMSGMGLQHMETLELTGDHELRIEIATGSVSGTLRDATDGEPVTGAALKLEPLDSESLWPRSLVSGSPSQSDSRGHFLVPQVRQGSWRVIATKAGYGPGEATVTVAGGAAPEVEIRMWPTEGVTFDLVLESGAVVPAVQVVILAPPGRPLAGGSYPVAEGKVRVPTVPPGRWDLVIQGGDSAVTRVTVDSPGDQGRVVLPTGGTLLIQVPDLAQEPMASVVLEGPDGKPFISTAGLALGPGEWILSSGRTVVPALVPGVWSFTVKSRDGRSWSGSATVTAGETTEVRLP